MLHTVLIHKTSKRRGPVMPAAKAAQWRWGSGEIDNFDFVDVDLTPEEVEDIRHERKIVLLDGTVQDVPEEDWLENKVRLDAAAEMFRLLEQRYGTAGAKGAMSLILATKDGG